MKKKKLWPYKPYEPLNLSSGKYQIWIFAADRLGSAHSPGKSACAWEIRDEHGELVESPEPMVTARTESKQWRGYIAASTRSLERIPDHSSAVICSRNVTFLQSIEAVDTNKRNGWHKKQGGMIEDTDIWERLLLARDGDEHRALSKIVTVRESISEFDEEIIKRLQKKTAAALDMATKKKRRGK
jgi:hypothetical protein